MSRPPILRGMRSSDSNMSKAFRLVLIGFGNVGRRFAALLHERQDVLRLEHGVTWKVIAIATRRHGTALDHDGLDVAEAAGVVARGESLSSLCRGRPPAADGLSLL